MLSDDLKERWSSVGARRTSLCASEKQPMKVRCCNRTIFTKSCITYQGEIVRYDIIDVLIMRSMYYARYILAIIQLNARPA